MSARRTPGWRSNSRKARCSEMKSILTALLMLSIGSVPAWAALGDTVASVDSDTQALHGRHVLIAKAGYNLHQITLKDGGVIKEFVSPAGMVFGISWTGPFAPNLQQLLGTYLTHYQQGQVVQHVPRRMITIHGDNFVYTSSGTMRNFRGRAYVPGLVPAKISRRRWCNEPENLFSSRRKPSLRGDGGIAPFGRLRWWLGRWRRRWRRRRRRLQPHPGVRAHLLDVSQPNRRRGRRF